MSVASSSLTGRVTLYMGARRGWQDTKTAKKTLRIGSILKGLVCSDGVYSPYPSPSATYEKTQCMVAGLQDATLR